MKINLEQEMIKSKEKTISKLKQQLTYESSLLNQVNGILENNKDQDLQELRKAGLYNAIDNASNVEAAVNKTESMLKGTLNPRIFTIEEIKDIAVKYGLRFLNSSHYKGSIPNDLAQKIREFKELGMSQAYSEGYSWSSKTELYSILAPSSSFNLQERPKDPLFFAKLGDGTYYLIHKWGNDLSMWNYVTNLPFRNRFTFSILLLSCISTFVYSAFLFNGILSLVFLIITVLSVVLGLFIISSDEGRANSYHWNNPFEN